MKKLFLVETAEEVETLIQKVSDFNFPENAILSFSVESSVALKEKRIVYWSTENFLDKEGHRRGVVAVEKNTRALIDDLIIVDNLGLKSTYTNLLNFYARSFLNCIIMNFEIIQCAIDKFKPDALQFFYYQNPGYHPKNFLKRELILGHQAKLFTSVKLIAMPAIAHDRSTDSSFKTFAKNIVDLSMNFLERIRYLIVKRDKPIFYYSLKFNFDELVGELSDCSAFNLELDKNSYLKFSTLHRNKVISSLHLSSFQLIDDKVFKNSLHQAITQWQKKSQKSNLLSWQDKNFSSFLNEKFIKCYVPVLKQLNAQIHSLAQWFEIIKPKAVVAPMARGISYALGELATLRNVPSFLISHGSHVPPVDEPARFEWEDHGKGLIDTAYQYHALQTPWAVKYVKALNSSGSYIDIKPFIFQAVDPSCRDHLRKMIFPDLGSKKIVMHAGTPKSRLAARFYVYETVDEYIKNMIDLIEATRALKDIFLVLRFRPLADISIDQLKKLLPSGDHYMIASGGNFYDYLCVTDLLVSFSSTTIEEALLSHVPVLQYDPTDRYCHIPGTKASEKGFEAVDSVYFVGQQQLLKSSLAWILVNHLHNHRDLPRDLFERHSFDTSKPSLSQVIGDVLAGKTVNSWTVSDKE